MMPGPLSEDVLVLVSIAERIGQLVQSGQWSEVRAAVQRGNRRYERITQPGVWEAGGAIAWAMFADARTTAWVAWELRN